MIKSFETVLKNIDGADLKEPGNDVPITLKSVAVNALLATMPNDSPAAEEKVKRFILAMKIQGSSGEIDLTPEDIVLIKRMVGQAMATLIVGQAFALLDA